MTYRYAHLNPDTGENRMKNDARCPVAHCTPKTVVNRFGDIYDCVCERGHEFIAVRYRTHVECRAK